MKKFLCVLTLLVSACGASFAGTILEGSITSDPGNGMYATAGWRNGGAQLTWNVTQQQDGKWRYVYDWVTDAKALSHLIVQVSETFGASDVLHGTTSGWELGTWSGTTQGTSNVGIPAPLYGLKFPGGSTSEEIIIVTDFSPMIGSFYVKDGRDAGFDVFAYNSEFSSTGTAYTSLQLSLNETPEGYIPVPGTLSVSSPSERVPEPAILSLFLEGIGVICFYLKKQS